ncbi:MAG: Uncharacterised protein [Opitutia bacterium UBA7350]|nr:MAG: Uncharacterised protein [Opitutae bacterium UBA7350]
MFKNSSNKDIMGDVMLILHISELIPSIKI